MIKVYLKKKIENSSKLNRTLSRIENKLFIIEKKKTNQLIKVETYVNTIKTITKMIKNEEPKRKRSQKNDNNKYNDNKKGKKTDHKNKERS